VGVAYRGAGKGFYNEASPIVAEFNARTRLVDLGYRSNIDDLDCFKAECFILISSELDRRNKEKKNARS